MKSVKYLLILIFGFSISFAFSQKDTNTIPKIWIKTSPLHYFDPYNGCNYNFGLEYRINSEISMNTEFGKIFVWSPNNDHNGFFVRHEVKKYLLNLSVDREILYFSGEFSYSKQSFTRTDEIYIPNDTSYFKAYFTERNFIGLSGLFGSIREYDCGFVFEIMAGFGLRYNMVTNDLTDEESEGRELGDWTVPTNYLIKKGNHIIPRFHLGIKVGWRISK